MKNKIGFPKNNDFESRQFINQTSSDSSFDQNLFSDTNQIHSFKSSKIIKGKVKIQSRNSVSKHNNGWLGDEEELEIVSKRMLLFLKFILLFLIVTSIFILIKKNVH